jgi:alkyl hydroperoxide reductase subunit AhpC
MKSIRHAVLALAACAAILPAAEPLALTGTDGNPVSVSLQGKTTAVIFVSVQCPVSNDYNGRMKALYSEYKQKGIDFVFVNSNSTESAAEVVKHAQDNGFTFPVHKDVDNKVADRFNAQVTPEVLVFDKTGKIAYHGSIDDSRAEARISKRPMKDALDAIVAGKAVPVAESKAFGCTIKRAKKQS